MPMTTEQHTKEDKVEGMMGAFQMEMKNGCQHE
jgi:hypothetical protein